MSSESNVEKLLHKFHHNLSIGDNCKFCGMELETEEEKIVKICNSNSECIHKKLIANTKVLPCGHCSYGIKNESKALPCLQPGCLSSKTFQTAEHSCVVCLQNLQQAPCIQLDCGHIFHYECIQQMLEKKWSGTRISFGFCNCPLCGQMIQHPDLAPLLKPICDLKQQIESKCLMRLKYENLEQHPEIVNPKGKFFNNKLGFGLSNFAYYPCYECKQPYFGGMKQCDENFINESFDPKELVCGSCASKKMQGVKNCEKHGTEFITYKCRYCCKVAIWFCFGTTHFCDSCHTNHATVIKTPIQQLPTCCGPQLRPSRGNHPQNGTEDYSVGCSVCLSNFSSD